MKGLIDRGTSERAVDFAPADAGPIVVPRRRVARLIAPVWQEASFGFHRARTQYGTETMWNGYPADIKAWIKGQGGLSAEFKWMSAPDTYRFFKHC